MKNILKKITAVLTMSSMALGFAGCDSDLLDTVPNNSFSSANVWESTDLARAAVMGVYNGLYDKFSKNYTGGTMGMPFDTWASVMDVDMNWKNNCFVIAGNCTPSSSAVATHYKFYYNIIYRANDVINNISNVPDMADTEKHNILQNVSFCVLGLISD